MLHSCVNVEHLRLCENSMRKANVEVLVEALQGDLGDWLLSLDLSDNNITGAGVEMFCAFLSNPARVPALTELRLARIDKMGG